MKGMDAMKRGDDTLFWCLGVSVLMLLLVLQGCGILNPDEHFVVRVTSISAPDTVMVDDTVLVLFEGSLGSTLCSGLDRVEKRREKGLLELRFHGVRRVGGICLQQPARLEYREELAPPWDDPFIIRVLQPDDTALEKIIRVR